MSALVKKGASSKKKASEKIKILFVCTGNTCRSAMAEYIMKDYLKNKGQAADFTITGAGISADIGRPMSENAIKTLSEMLINASKHKAKQLSLRMAQNSDLIVCMTSSHKIAIGTADKLMTISEITGGADVDDPFGQDICTYRSVAEYLKYSCPDIELQARRLHDVKLAKKVKKTPK